MSTKSIFGLIRNIHIYTVDNNTYQLFLNYSFHKCCVKMQDKSMNKGHFFSSIFINNTRIITCTAQTIWGHHHGQVACIHFCSGYNFFLFKILQEPKIINLLQKKNNSIMWSKLSPSCLIFKFSITYSILYPKNLLEKCIVQFLKSIFAVVALIYEGLRTKVNQPTSRGYYILASSALRFKSERVRTTRFGLVHSCSKPPI